MEIKINVSDEKFKEIFEHEMNALSQEDLSNALLEGIKEYVKSEDGQQNLIKFFVTQDSWSYRGTDLLSNIIRNSVNSIEWKQLTDEITNDMVDKLKYDHGNLINQIFKNMFIDKLAQSLGESWYMKETVRQVMNEMRQ